MMAETTGLPFEKKAIIPIDPRTKIFLTVTVSTIMVAGGTGGIMTVVILDEATASIDPENEHLIQQAISELTVGKTVIVIAHRLATIEHADQILVVDAGQIVQQGTHTELIQQNGLYRRFIDIREQAEGWSIA